MARRSWPGRSSDAKVAHLGGLTAFERCAITSITPRECPLPRELDRAEIDEVTKLLLETAEVEGSRPVDPSVRVSLRLTVQEPAPHGHALDGESPFLAADTGRNRRGLAEREGTV